MNAAKEKSVFQEQLIWLAPVISLLAGLAANEFGGLSVPACLTLGIALWTALWWIFEAIPIPVASLIPLALLPLVGVLTPLQVAQKYGHPLVLLLLGGFLLSKAMEKSGAHRRIALLLVHACPKGDKFLLLGFCLLYTSPSPRDGLLSRMPSSA